MSNYFVKFVAHLDRLRRPDSWPEQVELVETFINIESSEHLKFSVNKRFVELVTSAGLVVPKNGSLMEDLTRVTYTTRMFIPWHMVVYFEMDDPKLISELMPQTSQDILLPGSNSEEPNTTGGMKQ